MAQYTKKAILQTFQEMLEKMPFDKITVSAIVSNCEISSNTFYYHYQDMECVTSAISGTESPSAVHKIVPELSLRHDLHYFIFISNPTVDIETNCTIRI